MSGHVGGEVGLIGVVMRQGKSLHCAGEPVEVISGEQVTTVTATVSASDFQIDVQFKSKNPFKERLEFSVENAKSIEIHSLLGKIVYSKSDIRNQKDFSINNSYFLSGIYILKVITDKGFASKKLIRE